MRPLAVFMLASSMSLNAAMAASPPTNDPSTNSANDSKQPAVWKTHDLTFRYSGFTTRYSCIGLRDTLRKVVLALGARPQDLKIRYLNCGEDTNRPSPFTALNLHFASLDVAPASAADDLVSARWQPLNLTRAAELQSGDCELAETIQSTLLQYFSTRNGRNVISCPNRQLPTAAPALIFEVLLADAPNR